MAQDLTLDELAERLDALTQRLAVTEQRLAAVAGSVEESAENMIRIEQQIETMLELVRKITGILPREEAE